MSTPAILKLSRTLGLSGFILAALLLVLSKIQALSVKAILTIPQAIGNSLVVNWSLVPELLIWTAIALTVLFEGFRAIKHKQFFIFERIHDNLGLPGALALSTLGIVTIIAVLLAHLSYWNGFSYSVSYPKSFPFDLLILLVLACEISAMRGNVLRNAGKEKQPFQLKTALLELQSLTKKFGLRIAAVVFAGWTLSNSFAVVPESHVGLIAEGGLFNNNPPLQAGMRFKIPFWQEAAVYRPFKYERVRGLKLNGQAVEISYSYVLKEEFGPAFLRESASGHDFITYDINYQYIGALQYKINTGEMTLDEAAIKQGLTEFIETLYSKGSDKTSGWLKNISVTVKINDLNNT